MRSAALQLSIAASPGRRLDARVSGAGRLARLEPDWVSMYNARLPRGGWACQAFPRVKAAKVAELVDALDLGSSPARGGSSILPFRTRILFGRRAEAAFPHEQS